MNKALFMYYLQLNNFSVTSLADNLPISRQSLHDKISGRSDFKTSEIKEIKNILKLKADDIDQIFFADFVSS